MKLDELHVSSNIGVGTTEPIHKLDVHGSANVGALSVTSVSGLTATDIPSLDASKITSGTVVRPVHTTEGIFSANIGIGTTIPAYALDVHGSANVGALTVTSLTGLQASDVPYLSANKITSGTFDVARIPDFDGSKITTGIVEKDRISTTLNNTTIESTGNAALTIHDSSGDDQSSIQYLTDTYTWTTGLHGGSGGVFKISNGSFGTNDYFTINTSGDVHISNTITSKSVTQTDIPIFRVQLTNGSITGTGDIDYNSVLYDNTSSYDAATGRFTAPIAGYYFFTAHGISTNGRTIYDFTIDGTRQQINSLVDAPATGFAQCNISATLHLTAGQYVSVYQVEGSTYGESSTSNHNIFSGFFVG